MMSGPVPSGPVSVSGPVPSGPVVKSMFISPFFFIVLFDRRCLLADCKSDYSADHLKSKYDG